MIWLRKFLKVIFAFLIAFGLFIYVREHKGIRNERPPFPFQTEEFQPEKVFPWSSPLPSPSPSPHFKKVEFDSSNLIQVRARAKEILEKNKKKIEFQAELPLREPQVRGDKTSAHVLFQETWNGIPLAPLGTVSMDISGSGELIGFYSTYVPNLRVTNEKKLDPLKGRVGGRVVVWVSRENITPNSRFTEGRIAYEFLEKGHQVVIDAENGKILFQRDRKKFERIMSIKTHSHR